MAEALHPARWWHRLDAGGLQCDLCPRECRLGLGQRGACFVRQNLGHQMVLTTYGRSSGLQIDPVEKKPLFHFYPGTRVLSLGTIGCNLACRFCQNWSISKSRDKDRLLERAEPEAIARAAKASGCRSVAFTYNDPVIFAEYAMDTADACHELGIETIAVTAGYVQEEPRRAFFSKMDAANVDLKAFTDAFYFRFAVGHLQPVLDTLCHIKHETSTWLEITTLLIPGLNDSSAEITELTRWIVRELGPEVPLHFSAFHPDHKLRDLPPTPPDSLTRARQIARGEGLQFVYTGNVQDRQGGTTFCPSCQEPLIVRNWYEIEVCMVTEDGKCPRCGRLIPGCYSASPSTWNSPLNLRS
jgi:pyruvate formate lyase activating enzyme